MHLETYLKKYFDIEVEMVKTDFSNEKDIKSICVYEKGEDAEPAFVLYDVDLLLDEEGHFERRANMENTLRIGNIYSKLNHGSLIKEKELRKLIKSGNVL